MWQSVGLFAPARTGSGPSVPSDAAYDAARDAMALTITGSADAWRHVNLLPWLA
jgi:hypothetical protein